ncbi:hypothetical protein HY990_07250 [Candidatus Micrarchaeota archaeon]|nr:hypothetical protein [Candidatus Micrarchaeota archaeon]
MTEYEGAKDDKMKIGNIVGYAGGILFVTISIIDLIVWKDYFVSVLGMVVGLLYIGATYMQDQVMKRRKYIIDNESIFIEPPMFLFGKITPLKIQDIDSIDLVISDKKGLANFEYKMKNVLGGREFVRLPSVYLPKRSVVLNTRNKMGLFFISYVLTPRDDQEFINEIVSKNRKEIRVNEIHN